MTSMSDMIDMDFIQLHMAHDQRYRRSGPCIALHRLAPGGMSPLEFISFLDEEIDEQVPVAVTRLNPFDPFGRFRMFQSCFRVEKNSFHIFHLITIPTRDLFYLYPSFLNICDTFLPLIVTHLSSRLSRNVANSTVPVLRSSG